MFEIVKKELWMNPSNILMMLESNSSIILSEIFILGNNYSKSRANKNSQNIQLLNNKQKFSNINL